MSIIGYVALALLLGLVLKLRGRVEDIENQLKAPVTATAAPPVAAAGAPLPVTPAKKEPAAIERLVDWVKDDWLLKLGALLLLIGFGWLASYAFINNWIGPMGRIALGIVAGVLILALGWWRIQKYLHQGSIFTALGSTVILLTIFAAREIYGFFTPGIALGVMFLSTALVALVAVRYKSKGLAIISLALAGVAPLLTNSPQPNYETLFAYLLVVVLGTLWVVYLTRWRELTTTALILVAFYSLPHLISLIDNDRGVLLYFAYAFAVLFFASNTWGMLKLKSEELKPDLITAVGNGMFLLAWILVAAPEEWQSLILVGWMLLFSAGAFAIYWVTKRREPFYVYAAVGVAMLAAATAVQLDGAALTIAYTVETALISIVVYGAIRDLRMAERLSLLFIGPVVLSVTSITARAWRTSVFHDDFFTLLILAASMGGLGLAYWNEHKRLQKPADEHWHAALMIIGSIYAYLLLWLSLHAAFANDDYAVMTSLVIFTLVGLGTYFQGRRHGNKALNVYGGILLGFVVGRLLLIDVWDMVLTTRIIVFFLVGTLLVSTAFVGRKREAKKSSNPTV